jgi:hypothetical protein
MGILSGYRWGKDNDNDNDVDVDNWEKRKEQPRRRRAVAAGQNPACLEVQLYRLMSRPWPQVSSCPPTPPCTTGSGSAKTAEEVAGLTLGCCCFAGCCRTRIVSNREISQAKAEWGSANVQLHGLRRRCLRSLFNWQCRGL